MASPDKDYYSYCLQANLTSAIQVLSKSKKTDSQKVRSLRKKVLARFVNQSEVSRINCADPMVLKVISTYRNYYRSALMNRHKISRLNDDLYEKLRAILTEVGKRQTAKCSPKLLEQKLAEELKNRGFYSLFGAITPLRSLLIWQKQSPKVYTVSLPERKQKVKVIFMEDFLELSWLHYATFGKYYVGGWAKKEALYCVKQAYKVGTSEFMTHYLAHEAQHFADYKRFPKLEQTDLEYRAKIAELALTKKPKKFIKKLRAEAKDDRGLPHCFAAFKIISQLELDNKSVSLNRDAAKLLTIHSKSLRASGAKTVRSAL